MTPELERFAPWAIRVIAIGLSAWFLIFAAVATIVHILK